MKKIFKHKTQLFFSPPDPEGKSLVILKEFEPTTQDERLAKGTLFIVAEIWSSVGFDTQMVSRMVEDTFGESFYKNKQDPPLISLERSLSQLRQVLIEYVSDAPKLSSSGLNFNVVGAVLWGQVTYLSFLGEGRTFLFREGEVREISPKEGEDISTASGTAQSGDAILIGSGTFAQQFPSFSTASDLGRLESDMRKKPFSRSSGALLIKMEAVEVLDRADSVDFLRSPASRNAITKWGSALWARCQSFWRSRRFRLGRSRIVRLPTLPKSGNSLKIRPSRNSRWRWWVALAVVFIVSSVLVIAKRRQLRRDHLIEEFLAESKVVVDQASDFIGLNNSRARELLEEQLRKLDSVLGLATDNPDLLEEKRRLLDLYDRAGNTSRISDLSPYYDFARQSPSSFPTLVKGLGSQLLVLDPGSRFLYQIDTTLESVAVEKGILQSQDNLDNFTCGEARCWLLRGSEVGVVSRVDLEYYPVPFEEDWVDQAVDLQYYQAGGDALYWLVPSQNQIYKTLYEDQAFYVSTWLEEEDISLADAVSLAIDGDIYLGFADGRVVKFHGGKQERFTLQSPPEALISLSDLYTQVGFTYLYILDAPSRRVLLFTKDGYYHSQYIFEDADLEPKSLWVDGRERSLYVLAGTRVFKIPLSF